MCAWFGELFGKGKDEEVKPRGLKPAASRLDTMLQAKAAREALGALHPPSKDTEVCKCKSTCKILKRGAFQTSFAHPRGFVKQVIVVRTDLKMGVGKIAGQVGHAAVLGYKKTAKEFPSLAQRWEEEGARKVVVKVGSEKEFFSLYEKVKCVLPCALVHDAGKTQIKAGTPTCFAIGPYYEKEIDEFTKGLKLL